LTGIDLEASVVHSAQVNYGEGSGWFLDHHAKLKNPADGIIDSIHGLRMEHYADAVVLIVAEESPLGVCAAAPDIYATPATAFVVVDVRPICVANYSFAHEIAHLFGAMHDRAVIQEPVTFPVPYSHGWVHPEGWMRTIMAYGDACNDCARWRIFSAPVIAGSTYGTIQYEDVSTIDERAGDHRCCLSVWFARHGSVLVSNYSRTLNSQVGRQLRLVCFDQRARRERSVVPQRSVGDWHRTRTLDVCGWVNEFHPLGTSLELKWWRCRRNTADQCVGSERQLRDRVKRELSREVL